MCIQSFMWKTGWNPTLDLLICQMWHGGAIYWFWVLISTWNLVFIAFERYMLISHTHKYRNMRGKQIYAALMSMYAICILLRIPGCLQVRYDAESEKCLAKYYYDTDSFKNFMSFFGCSNFCIFYAFPALSLVMLYAKIIASLRGRQQALEEINQRSHVFDTAEHQLTKSGLIVTIVFILCLTWDSWCYVLARFHVISYEMNSWQSVLGAFLVAINSCVNPFIYAGALPIFRKSLKKTFSIKTWEYGSMTSNIVLTLTKTKSNLETIKHK